MRQVLGLRMASGPRLVQPLVLWRQLRILYLFLERGEERERNINVGLPLTRHNWGPGLQPRQVPWVGIQPTTLRVHRPMLQSTEPHQPGLNPCRFYEHLPPWRMEAEKLRTEAWVMVKHTQFLRRGLIFWAWRLDLTLGFSECGIIFALWSVDPNEEELVELSRTCISAFSFSYFIYCHIVLI